MIRLAGNTYLRSQWLQAGLLIGLWWVCAQAGRALALPVPGGILALAVLLGLLLSGRLRTDWVHRGTDGLMEHMLLFFVPAVMALMNHRELLGLLGVKLFLAILASTLVVMVGTALAVDLSISWRQAHAA